MRISDWSSDVCSSDLKRTDIDRSQGALPHLIAFGDRIRVHGLHELDSGIARPELFRRTVLSGSFVRDRRIGDEDLRGMVATRSEEHTSELQTLIRNSYTDCSLKKNKKHSKMEN